LEAGSFFAYGPGMPVSIRTTTRAMVKYFVSLTGAGARRAFEAPVRLLGSHLSLKGHAEFREILDLMIREGGEHPRNVGRICLNLFRRLQLKLEQAEGHRGELPDRAREQFLQCKALLESDPVRFRSLAEVAAGTGLARPRLFRLFRRYQGSTPYQYLLRQKMNVAARDLIGTDRLVKEVAAMAGFGDPLHFSRVFKSVYGISPSRLRASLRE
jgi:AraC-like DNA-binding protein